MSCKTEVSMSTSTESMDIKGLKDIEPPFGVHLSGVYKKSFAYATIKDRLPVILTKAIDTMSRDKEEIARKYGPEAADELKQVIGDVSKLKSEMMRNKPLTPLPLANSEADGDAEVWNEYLRVRGELEGPGLTWFHTVWLLCECYMYRRLNQALAVTRTLRTYDPFEKQKQAGFSLSANSIKLLARHTLSLLSRTENVSTAERKHELVKLLKLNLWGNRCDLSLSSGAESNSVGNPVELLDSFESDLLVDDTKLVWDVLHRPNGTGDPVIVDIVLDNAGYELFTDLCLAAFLVTHKLADKVRFYVKRMPWFISDVNLHDFHWTVDNMRNLPDPDLKAFGDICAKHLENNVWTVEVESFWTEPYEFGRMKEAAPALYEKLAQATLVVFKGDLNYRKLMADINWEHTKSLTSVLTEQGFCPTNLVTLRTIKADVCVGLAPGTAEELSELNKDWMTTGKYGVINAVTATTGVSGGNQ